MADAASHWNALPEADARAALLRCCGAPAWVAGMLAARPFASLESLYQHADELWFALSDAQMLEAFSHHPRIGENLEVLRARYAAQGKPADATAFSSQEQAKLAEANEDTLLALCDANRAYEARFGFIFLVFASGKSAAEMLALLRERLTHERAAELRTARREHAKITALRLSKVPP